MPSLLYAGENDTIVIYDRAANGDLQRRPEPVLLPRPVRSLAFAPDRYHLYVATKGDTDSAAAPPLLLTFAVDQATGALAPVGEGVPMPKVPAYVTTDRSGRWLLAAAYDQPGHCCVFSIGSNGYAAGPPVCTHDDLRYSSHFIDVDPTNRFAFVPCVAAADHTNGNAIHCFSFDSATGQLKTTDTVIPPPTGPTPSPRFDGPLAAVDTGFSAGSDAAAPPPYNQFGTRPELGPRHFTFHPYLPLLYTANEQGNSTSVYQMEPSSGRLTHLETVSTVPNDFADISHCAEITMHPSGRWLFVTNRALPETGCCSVAIFGVGDTGRVSLSDIAVINDVPPSFSPQHITLDATGQHFYVADGMSLLQYFVDVNHGRLVRVNTYTCQGSDGDQIGGMRIIDLAGAQL